MTTPIHTNLSSDASARLESWLRGGFLPAWAYESLNELIKQGDWEELEERFYRELAFGTGGMRGRVIGRKPAPTELGLGGTAAPAHPAVGANTVNDVTVARATLGLFRQVAATSHGRVPKLVVAHDVRHFSRRFAELAARIWTHNGGKARLFAGPRSTPQLSFTVRVLNADAGIVITASHNPPHDNGYKVYAVGGGQVVPPQAGQIMDAVAAVRLEELGPLLAAEAASAAPTWKQISWETERAYIKAASEAVLDHDIIHARRPSIVFSALHGTGSVSIPTLLREAGAEVSEVAVQSTPDPNFSTVKSPNPEEMHTSKDYQDEGNILKLAFDEAENIKNKCSILPDVVLATDPDADRIGAAFRKAEVIDPITGNELGALLTEYRLMRAKELGLLPCEGSQHAVVLKTFVTTPLLDAIARTHGVRCVNTLTGFKWMGAKLRDYDRVLFAKLASRKPRIDASDFFALPARERIAHRLRHSSWVVFAAEESYGCLAGDAARDKDANVAALLCAELAAWLSAQGKTAADMLEKLYAKHGYHAEYLRTIAYEGSAGAAKIRCALTSLRQHPPATFGDHSVTKATDFLQPGRKDEEGEPLPREDFLLYDLDGGWRCAVRGSGTEPKLKLYFFVREPAATPRGDIAHRSEEWIGNTLREIQARADS